MCQTGANQRMGKGEVWKYYAALEQVIEIKLNFKELLNKLKVINRDNEVILLYFKKISQSIQSGDL